MTPIGLTSDPVSSRATAARVHALGAILGMPVDRLLEVVGRCEHVRFRRRRLATTLGQDTLSLVAEARSDIGEEVLGFDAARILGRRNELFVEVSTSASGDLLAIELHALGRRALDADVALLRGVIAAPDGVGELAALLAPGGHSAGLGVRVRGRARRWSLHLPLIGDGAPDRLAAAASAVGVTVPQRDLVARLHPVLARGCEVVATLQLAVGAMPELSVTYHDVSFELVTRLRRLGVEQAARLGKLAGACGAERVAAMTLGLGASEPMTVRLAIELMH